MVICYFTALERLADGVYFPAAFLPAVSGRIYTCLPRFSALSPDMYKWQKVRNTCLPGYFCRNTVCGADRKDMRILPETAGERRAAPDGVTAEKSRPVPGFSTQDSGTRTSLKGACEPGMANRRRSVQYGSLPYGNPGTASFPEPEQRQGRHAFLRRPEYTLVFRLPECKK